MLVKPLSTLENNSSHVDARIKLGSNSTVYLFVSYIEQHLVHLCEVVHSCDYLIQALQLVFATS